MMFYYAGAMFHLYFTDLIAQEGEDLLSATTARRSRE